MDESLLRVSRKYKRNSDEEVNQVREMYLIEGIPARIIERRTGVSRWTVYQIARGIRRANVPLSPKMEHWLQARLAEEKSPRPLGRDHLLALSKRIVIPGEQD